MEANQDKADALAQKVVGDDQKQMEGYKERTAIREVLGERLAREITLEPKPSPSADTGVRVSGGPEPSPPAGSAIHPSSTSRPWHCGGRFSAVHQWPVL